MHTLSSSITVKTCVTNPQASQVCEHNFVTYLQGLVTSDEAAAMLSEPELEASDLVPDKYEGSCN
jgi:hypothetical protein